ncbi:anthocyanidin 3-O-glucosyltransferase 7-like [Pistacia vera]|uniref:anthocyanidin 3-O-glucosyltransferase 7-like n=1 Tax=Pistacia vera TaxID=55513 RepID=UPI0012634B95|nr:anthocyanidin 3-O-glucosyltransferase 7-like [Pistacia vera]
MAEAKRSQKHIAVLTFPFTSHVPPLLSLIRKLSAAAPDVKFSFFSTAQVNASYFSNDDEFDKIKPFNVDSGLPEDYVRKGEGLPKEEVGFFLKATPGNFQKAIQTAVAETGLEISCLITEAFLWFAAGMAKEMQIPWIPFWISGPQSLLVHFETDNLRQKLGINGPEDRTLEILPGFSKIRAKDIPDGIIYGAIDSPFAIMMQKMAQMLPHATAVATNSFEEFDPIVVNALKSRLPNFLNVGPFILTSSPPQNSDPHGCLEWLNGHEKSSVAYIGFGNAATPPPHEIKALAEALEASRTPFLWSLRGKPEEQLPEGFLERTKDYGKIVPWAPQIQVLAHSSVGVHVTHCGWNSVVESVNGVVPMICRTFFADQGLHLRMVEAEWGIGLEVEGGKFTKDGTMKALRAILCTKQGKIMREKIGVLKQLGVKAAGSEGSSTANFKALVEIITSKN